MALAPLQSPILHLSLSPFTTPLSCPEPPPPMDPNPLSASGLPLSPCLQCSPLAPGPPGDVPCLSCPPRQPLQQHLGYASPSSCPTSPCPSSPRSSNALAPALWRGNPAVGCTTGTEGNRDGTGSLQHQAGMLRLQWVGIGVLLPQENFCRRHWKGTRGQILVCLLPSA